MLRYLMLGIASSNILINLGGIICVFLFSPQPYAALGLALTTSMIVLFTQIFKKQILIKKLQKLSMILFACYVLLALLYLVLGLVMLIYLKQVQNGQLKVNPNLDQLMWQRSDLTFGQVTGLTLVFYLGNWVSIGFYARQYYRMFWVHNIVHIFRILKTQVNHMNQSLLSHLPIIQVSKDLKKEKCCLCIQFFQDYQVLTKLNCEHIFHRDCIRLWVMRSNACPLCRKRVVFY